MISVISTLRDAAKRVFTPVRADLKADPSLRYVLLLALATCGFGVWFRVPNFAGPDEYSRLLQPMKAAGEFVADPGLESIRRGVTDGRALGATFYLYAIILAPVFLLVVVSGQLGEFATLGTIQSRWDLWHAAPAWFWKASLLLGRLVSVALGVGCVYLTYRLGVRLKGRFAGKFAAVLLALSPGFFSQTHLVGEDAPMLFLLLVTILLADRYIETGDTATFLWGSLTGGLAIAFKLSGGVAAIVLGAALFVRAAHSDEPVSVSASPQLILGGLIIGAVSIWVGIPSVLVGGLPELIERLTGTLGTKTGKSGGFAEPIWYWFGYQYINGMGIPLFVSVIAGSTAIGWRFLMTRNNDSNSLYVLLVVSLIVFFAVYSRWEFVRLRHLVPTFPVLFIMFAAEIERWRDREQVWHGLRIALAALLVTTALFAGVAQYGYVSEPRDEATEWTAANVDDNAKVEVYENSVADVAAIHGKPVNHYDYPEEEATNTSDLILNESRYTSWMLAMPERQPDYIQLTDSELAYVEPDSTDSERYPRRNKFVDNLLTGKYNYTVVASFGYGGLPTETSRFGRIVDAGISPNVEGQSNSIVILKRTDQSSTSAYRHSWVRNRDPNIYPAYGNQVK
ncbi:glycosyltransferase family 39 protein [Halorubrum ezzemoulense]|uniref:ArnT family glycosyltransferase n=1 Tax=Halorubrum ezzemoulense TaxID=337243 RepID=UPI00232CEC27|nr:glycosyltransferase family 39 protein [Halorubrum ezzemoulense]MDB2225251.1 glycosyltransferase family 39 protein [Halorubrum ezzemoulense]